MADLDFPVSPQKKQELVEKMERLGIREADLEETFVRSQGRGGQKVNKAATCVQLVHRPTGIAVKCQASRSQALNRFFARRLLVERIEEMVLGSKASSRKDAQKVRRQKMKRLKRAKQKAMATLRKEQSEGDEGSGTT